MSGFLRGAALAALFCFSAAAGARDEQVLLGIDGALGRPEAQDRLDGTIRFYWGDAPHPEPLAALEIMTSTRRVSAVARSDLDACDKAFLTALLALRDRAKELGANAVVEIKSVYANREYKSRSQYECRAGYFSTTVTLEGQLVKLPPPGAAAVPADSEAWR